MPNLTAIEIETQTGEVIFLKSHVWERKKKSHNFVRPDRVRTQAV